MDKLDEVEAEKADNSEEEVNKLFFMTQHLFQLLIDENRRQINQISHVANVSRNIFS